MGKLKNLKKLEKLKPNALQLNFQPKRLLAITSLISITSELAKVQLFILKLLPLQGERGVCFLTQGVPLG